MAYDSLSLTSSFVFLASRGLIQGTFCAGRLWQSITRPAFQLDRKVDEISAAIIQIEKERDTLLSQRVDQLYQKVDQVHNNVEGKEIPFISRCIHR